MIKDLITNGSYCVIASMAGFENVDAAFLVQLLIALSALVFLANQVKNLFTRRPALHEEYATKAELQEVKNNLRNFEMEMREKFDDLNAADEARAIKLHDRINDVLRAVSTVAGKVEGKGQ